MSRSNPKAEPRTVVLSCKCHIFVMKLCNTGWYRVVCELHFNEIQIHSTCADIILFLFCQSLWFWMMSVCFWFYSFVFLTCVSITAHVIDIGWTSVRPSVSPSKTRWYCVETAQPIVKLSSLPGSPMILVFWGPNFFLFVLDCVVDFSLLLLCFICRLYVLCCHLA